MNTELFLSFYNRGLTDRQISKESKVCLSYVRDFRNSLNLKFNTKLDNHYDEISRLCNLNMTDSEIARKLNVAAVTINKYRKDNNLQSSPFIRTKFKNIEERIRGKMIVRSKSRAKKLNIEFNITIDDIILTEYCPLLNIKLDYIKKEQNNINAASLDRIDNTKGYVKGNVMIISVLANTMKSNATLEQLDLFCNNMKKILENHANLAL